MSEAGSAALPPWMLSGMASWDPAAWLAVVIAPFVGSFLGVVVSRYPHGGPTAPPRSACDHCGHVLKPRDLMPLLSWLATGGRCRHCGAWLGWFHPGIELAALALAVWAVQTPLPSGGIWVTCGLAWTLLAVALIAQRHHRVARRLVRPLLLGGLAVAAAGDLAALPDHLIGAAVGFLFLALHGRGEAELMAAAGAWLSWRGIPLTAILAAASLLTAAAALRRRGLPLGPHLAVALWLAWLYGPQAGEGA